MLSCCCYGELTQQAWPQNEIVLCFMLFSCVCVIEAVTLPSLLAAELQPFKEAVSSFVKYVENMQDVLNNKQTVKLWSLCSLR